MDLGPHASFILASYAATVIGIAGMIAWLVIDGHRQARRLEALEAKGIRRRSADGSGQS